MSHSQIIGEKGAQAIAQRLSVPAGRVRVWKSRGVIPRSIWAEMIEAFPDITLDALRDGEKARAAS